jgi:hypothetical protein
MLNDAGGALESFIMCVSLPVDPYFKTTSEVATLQFVRHLFPSRKLSPSIRLPITN